ncbi:MAG: FHA domain-containing protein [Myxococcaceae bacterium]
MSTRVVRAPRHEGPLPPGAGTVVFGRSAPPPAPPSARAAWAVLHRPLRSACLEEPRAGLMIAIVHPETGATGRMWLAATDEARAATLGRHDQVDLPLAPDASLSLRHELFVVRLVRGQVRFLVLDLASSTGTQTLVGAVSLVDEDRPVLLRTAGVWVFCVPTGASAPLLSSELDEAWQQLSRPARPRTPGLGFDFTPRTRGALSVTFHNRALQLPLDRGALDRGVLLGRDRRCDVFLDDSFTSRVHAVIVNVDGVPHLVDAGSTNGVVDASGRRVWCQPLRDGQRFTLGNAKLTWREG